MSCFNDSHSVGISDCTINNAGSNINNFFLTRSFDDEVATLRRQWDELHQVYSRQLRTLSLLYGANALGENVSGRGGKTREPSCFNCGLDANPLWRRYDAKNDLCNTCGLYFKVHGTHPPNSTRKTVIEGRDDPNMSPERSRMTDRAVPSTYHQAMRSLARLFVEMVEVSLLAAPSADGGAGGVSDDEADVVQQPPRKRARHSQQSATRCDKDGEHTSMEGMDDGDASSRISLSSREKRRRQNAAAVAAARNAARGRAQGFNRSASSPDGEPLAHPQRSADALETSSAGAHGSPGLRLRDPYRRVFPGSAGSGGSTLPPLAANAMDFTGFDNMESTEPVQMGFSVQGSHVRPGSNTPSRTHSPLGHDDAPGTTPEPTRDYGRPPQPSAPQDIFYPGTDQAAAAAVNMSSRGTNLGGMEIIGHLGLGDAAFLGMSALVELDRLRAELNSYKRSRSEEDEEEC